MLPMMGKTLGHYQITSQLGKGGMGEVHQAKDQKLGRDVAMKVVPEEFARDAERVARFQREAKLATGAGKMIGKTLGHYRSPQIKGRRSR
jgi:serine/threonine protein kinase